MLFFFACSPELLELPLILLLCAHPPLCGGAHLPPPEPGRGPARQPVLRVERAVGRLRRGAVEGRLEGGVGWGAVADALLLRRRRGLVRQAEAPLLLLLLLDGERGGRGREGGRRVEDGAASGADARSGRRCRLDRLTGTVSELRRKKYFSTGIGLGYIQ